jgi:hypothetical protein
MRICEPVAFNCSPQRNKYYENILEGREGSGGAKTAAFKAKQSGCSNALKDGRSESRAEAVTNPKVVVDVLAFAPTAEVTAAHPS